VVGAGGGHASRLDESRSRDVPAGGRPWGIGHNVPVATEGRHAGARKAPRKRPTLQPRVLLLAAAVTAAVVAWGYLVYLAVDFGTTARNGEGRGWWFLGVASAGAVLCLFLGLVLVARLLRALGITSPPEEDDRSEEPATRPPVGRRAAR
jgi:hypothetical protein